MKKKAFVNQDLIRTPAYPYKGREVFSRLRNALTMTVGYEPSYARLARMMGRALSSAHYWFYGSPHPQVIAFLSLLESRPERQRSELLNSYFRELPELDHLRLAHDPLAVSALKSWHRIFGSPAAVHLCQFVPTTPLKYSKLCQSGKMAQIGIVLNVAKLLKIRNLYT